MLVEAIIGTRSEWPGLETDWLELEWYETTRRIQRKKSNGGVELAIRLLKEGQRLKQDDVLVRDTQRLVAVHIRPCDAIVLRPQSLLEMGTVCYEIGNKHLPLFIQDDEVLMPYEDPMFRWLEASGYRPEKAERQLRNLLKSNVEPHAHGGGPSLFSRILNLGSN
jgi:urease accessory protein